MDHAAFRTTSRERWETAAPGWEARRAELQAAAEPVSQWMVEAIAPQPGDGVLELAAGLGDTGFMAAELIEPGGRLICTDGAEPMVEAAKRRAAELGLDNVEFEAMEAEWIDAADGDGRRRAVPLGLHAARRPGGGAAREPPGPEARRAARARRLGGPGGEPVGDPRPGRARWPAASCPRRSPASPGMFSFAGDGVLRSCSTPRASRTSGSRPST